MKCDVESSKERKAERKRLAETHVKRVEEKRGKEERRQLGLMLYCLCI